MPRSVSPRAGRGAHRCAVWTGCADGVQCPGALSAVRVREAHLRLRLLGTPSLRACHPAGPLLTVAVDQVHGPRPPTMATVHGGEQDPASHHAVLCRHAAALSPLVFAALRPVDAFASGRRVSFIRCVTHLHPGLQDEDEGALDDSQEGAEERKGAKRTKMAAVKGPWAKEEDDVVIRLVGQYGPKRWSLIASNLPGRECLPSETSCPRPGASGSMR